MRKFGLTLTIAVMLLAAAALMAQSGEGVVYYEVQHETGRINARTCPRLSCTAVRQFNNGARLAGRSIVNGDTVAGDTRWLEFIYQGQTLYAHISLVKALGEEGFATETTSSNNPAIELELEDWGDSVTYLNVGANVAFEVSRRALTISVDTKKGLFEFFNIFTMTPGQFQYLCCDGPELDYVQRSDVRSITVAIDQVGTFQCNKVGTAAGRESLEQDIYHCNDPNFTRTVNRGSPARPVPTLRPTPTMRPTPIPSSDPYIIFHEGGSVNLRSCPRTSCAVVRSGLNWQEVDVIGEVWGEDVLGSRQWFEVLHAGQIIYLHGSLASPKSMPGRLQNWVKREDRDEFTDQPVIFFGNRATQYETETYSQDPALIIRCGASRDDHEMEVYINWDTLVFGGIWNNLIDGQLRWDSEEPVEQNWYESSNNEATFLPDGAKGRFLRGLFTHNRLRVVIEDRYDRYFAEFEVTGFMSHFMPYAELCGVS